MRICRNIKILTPPGKITLRSTHEENKTLTQEDRKALTHLDINPRTVTRHQDLKNPYSSRHQPQNPYSSPKPQNPYSSRPQNP